MQGGLMGDGTVLSVVVVIFTWEIHVNGRGISYDGNIFSANVLVL